ncbi:hypothetical protein DFH28DRAFT_967016 [Melampsora americana]|nr:hypothetical protein DFH28DRAFT_967016 [Melampsora americana]
MFLQPLFRLLMFLIQLYCLSTLHVASTRTTPGLLIMKCSVVQMVFYIFSFYSGASQEGPTCVFNYSGMGIQRMPPISASSVLMMIQRKSRANRVIHTYQGPTRCVPRF